MPTPMLCATVTATTMAELLERRDAVDGADLVELRLDGVRDVDVRGALAGRRLPVIATCRAAGHGGRFDGAEETRTAILEQAWDLGAEFVDVEDGAGEALLRRSDGRRIVRSFHDFSGGVVEAPDRLAHLLGSGAAVAKLAVTATRLSDLVDLAALGRSAPVRTVILAMGEAGIASRVLAERMGARWTYAGDAVAPGQLSLARMRDEFRVQTIGPATRIFGVIGRPVSHSLSPAMHNAAFAAAGLDAVYVPLAAADFADFETFAAAFDVAGVSVTAPYKLDALAAAISVDTSTSMVGAANTLREAPGAAVGVAFAAGAHGENAEVLAAARRTVGGAVVEAAFAEGAEAPDAVTSALFAAAPQRPGS